MNQQISSAIKVSSLAIVLSFGLSYAFAWTAPTGTPPTGNVSAPLNTSGTAQTKAGALVFDMTGKSGSEGREALFLLASADNTTSVILANKPTITFWNTLSDTLADINAKNGVFTGNVDFGYEIVTNSVYSSGHFSVDVYCPAGKKVLGGGCNQQAGANRGLVDNNPIGNNGWHCRNRDISNAQAVTATTYAICARVQ